MKLRANPLEVNFTELFQALETISSKSQVLERVPGVLDVAVVARVRDLVDRRQQKCLQLYCLVYRMFFLLSKKFLMKAILRY